MSSEWNDRFDPSKYDDDEPVHLFRCDQYGPNDGGLWIPERIWHRLRWLGLSYELHLLPLLDGSTDPVYLNPTQVGQLLQEFRFVGQIVDDPVVESTVQAIIALSAERSDGASKDMVGIEFP
jgi:hypothetical protein